MIPTNTDSQWGLDPGERQGEAQGGEPENTD